MFEESFGNIMYLLLISESDSESAQSVSEILSDSSAVWSDSKMNEEGCVTPTVSKLFSHFFAISDCVFRKWDPWTSLNWLFWERADRWVRFLLLSGWMSGVQDFPPRFWILYGISIFMFLLQICRVLSRLDLALLLFMVCELYFWWLGPWVGRIFDIFKVSSCNFESSNCW